jgi:adenylate cyclase
MDPGRYHVNDTQLKQRLAAILAADAAGYSRLMAADARATVAALDAARTVFRTRIESNQGRVIDMAGDSVLAVFGTANGAVSAAIAIQQELNASSGDVPEDQRMRFRIGVHLGDLIEKPDGTVYGDGVNIASRLQALAEVGGITVSDAVQGAVRGKLTASFDDQGEHEVKNIPYPVRAYSVRTAGGAIAPPAAAAGGGDVLLPDKPSIAVLPFLNLSSDAEQEYFTDGVSEDIITELSRFRSLFVIARNSTFTYKGKAVDVRSVARELGVRYVLEGSIRRMGDRIRVTAQLIDALGGNHIWAEKFDRALEDVFAVQEEVTQAIVSAIAPQIQTSEIERARRVRPGNLSAYEIAMRAWAAVQLAMSETNSESRDNAIRFAREAIAIDPRCGQAWQALAFAQWQHVYFGTAASVDEARAEAFAACARAITIDSGDHTAHLLKGILQIQSGQQDAGHAEIRRAHELNPNDSFTLANLGFGIAGSGDMQLGVEYLTRALRLSPRDPSRYIVLNFLGWAYFGARDYANGADWAQQSARQAPGFASSHLCLLLNSVGNGDLAGAAAELVILRKLSPEIAERTLAGQWVSKDPVFNKRATTFMRIAAGLEDLSAAETVR